MGFAAIRRVCKKMQLVGIQDYRRSFCHLRFTFCFNGDLRMTLLELLVQELPKRGGWPKGAITARQDADFEICFNGNGSQGDFNYHELASDAVYDGRPTRLAVVTLEEYEAALAASNQPEWIPGVLPRCGIKCEWQDKNTKAWLPVTVVYASEWVTVIREANKSDAVEIAIENYGDESRRQFRPIRTKAERKREEARHAIAQIFRDSPTNGAGADSLLEAIDAGRIPGVKLED